MRRRPFQVDELEDNLDKVCAWNLRFEIPDVIAFADFRHSKRSVAEFLSASQRALLWDRAVRFPYPNGQKLREFVVLGAPDLTPLRASAGRIARPVDRRLSCRSFGNRTERSGSGWRFRDVGSAGWRGFIDSAILLLERGDINAMCATDIASYYRSIDLDRLETRLHDIGCDLHAVAVMISGLRKWVAVDGVMGVPIGPEASGILGNAFLIPVDRMLMALGAEYMRWMDDYKIMGRDEEACRSIVGSFDQYLRAQGLTRSVKKTNYYRDSFSGIAALRDGRLDSLGYWLNSGYEQTTAELRAAFERDIFRGDEAHLSRFRYIVQALLNRRDDYAASALASIPEWANADPRLSGEYLAVVGLNTQAVVDAMFSQLSSSPAAETDALALHLLRALAKRRGEWGTAEGDLFESIAESDFRRPPVRCWAVHAFSRTSRWRQATLMESAEAETDALVRRIKLTTLRKVRPGRDRTKFLRHMRAKYPELTHTVRWLEAA